ncbi:SIMPL domain-containing protein [Actinopolymorpha pittospori]
MDEQRTTLVSVRGEARMTVAPDFGVLNGTLEATEDTKPAALAAVAGALGQLTDALGSLGGVPRTADSQRSALTWSAYSATTQPEYDVDERTHGHRPTGRVIAQVAVSLVVREFDLVDRLTAALATHESFDVTYVSWGVDPDNPSWPEVRAEAVQAAIDKGRHYASALGGSLNRLEQIADAGLLDSGSGTYASDSNISRMAARASAVGMPETPSLDPVPRELVAVVDARFVADVPDLSGRGA